MRQVSAYLFKIQEGRAELEVMIRQNLTILAGRVTKRTAGGQLKLTTRQYRCPDPESKHPGDVDQDAHPHVSESEKTSFSPFALTGARQ